ncbi:MAG: tetratricopeptide repeat protein [Myxococcota bacterium]|nr:tetratricopeptide repeat protein [Myxococcota bacterium]
MLKRISVVALTVTLLFGFSITAFADIRADARKYYRTGMALLKSGKVDDGVEALEKAFSLMPHPNTLLTLARVFEQLKDWERSIHYYERYLEFDPIDKADVQELITKMRLKLNPAPATPAPAAPAANAAVVPAPSASEEAVKPKPAKQDEPRISATAVLREIALRLDRLAELTASPPIKQDADQLVEIAKALEADDPQVPLAPKVDAEVLMRQRGCASTHQGESLGIFILLVTLGLSRRVRLGVQ